MELKQVEYILKIAEENNITHAAEKLFITQSALNQQLLKLEKELGTPLFHRNRNNWSLTEAGEVYVKNARELLRIKKSTYDQIRDISNIQKGTLSIGYTPARGIRMFGSVYPAFHSVFPDITVIPTEGRVRELQPMIANDSLDIAFLTLNRSDFTGDEYIKLLDEEIYLIIPQEHPLSRYAAPVGEPRATLDINLLRNEPFVLMDKSSTMRETIENIFHETGFHPRVLFETKDNPTILLQVRSNICCSLVPAYYLRNNPEGIACFALPSHPTWQVCACHKKGRYLSDAAKYFIELAKNYWM
jgi:DNA-binding transcriptional LysR family regulator